MNNSIRKTANFLSSLLLNVVWTSGPGRALIRNGEIKPTAIKIEKLNSDLEKSICVLTTKKESIIPMQFIFESSNEKYFYSLIIDIKIMRVVILNTTEPLIGTTLSKEKTDSALSYWFKDLLEKPKTVRNDIKKIETKLKKRGG